MNGFFIYPIKLLGKPKFYEVANVCPVPCPVCVRTCYLLISNTINLASIPQHNPVSALNSTHSYCSRSKIQCTITCLYSMIHPTRLYLTSRCTQCQYWVSKSSFYNCWRLYAVNIMFSRTGIIHELTTAFFPMSAIMFRSYSV